MAPDIGLGTQLTFPFGIWIIIKNRVAKLIFWAAATRFWVSVAFMICEHWERAKTHHNKLFDYASPIISEVERQDKIRLEETRDAAPRPPAMLGILFSMLFLHTTQRNDIVCSERNICSNAFPTQPVTFMEKIFSCDNGCVRGNSAFVGLGRSGVANVGLWTFNPSPGYENAGIR
jgi:hypothetical protein